MKLDKKDLERIVEEEIERLAKTRESEMSDVSEDFGQDSTTSSAYKQGLKQQLAQSSDEIKGVSPRELHVIEQMNTILKAYAQKENLAGGDVMSLLKRVFKALTSKLS